MAAILSDLLNAVRVIRSDWAVIEAAPPACLRIPGGKSAYLHFVLEGQLCLDVEGHSRVLDAGAYTIILDGRPHTIGQRGPTSEEIGYFQHDHALCSPPILRFGGTGRLTRVLSGALEISNARGDLVRRGLPAILFGQGGDGNGALKLDPAGLERSAMGAGGMAFLGAIADVLLVQALRGAIAGMAPSENAAAKIFGTPQIGAALRLIDARPEKNWSVSSLAGEVGMSRSVFAAAFRQNVGDPPMQYITRLRIARSSRLLKSSALSVVKIAHKVGFGSASSFARAFKQQMGSTPGVYRRATRGKNHRFRQPAAEPDRVLA